MSDQTSDSSAFPPSAGGRTGSGAPTAPVALFERAIEALLEACWLAALAAMPVFFNVYSARIFEPDKVAVLRLLAVVAAAAWLVKILAGGRAWVPAFSLAAATASTPATPRTRPLALLLPAAAVAASAVLSTALSVSPWRSFFGSFVRQQGLLTTASTLLLAAAVLAHLRRHEQWRRARFAVIASSLPAAGYALLQSLGRDPIGFPHDEARVSSTLGNPIFLGAYLTMALLVTLDALADAVPRARRRGAGPREAPADRAAAIALAAAAAAQGVGFALTQSRGPLAGLTAGALLAALLAALAVPRPRTAGPAPRRRAPLVLLAGATLALAAAVLAWHAAAPPLREMPLLGRFVSAFDPADGTRRVRLLIWKGAVELAAAAPPLRTPAGAEDPLHAVRRIVGYGPECFDLAFNRVYPAALGRVESRSAVPDRAHNEPFDLLVTQGALGVVAWLWLLAAVLGAVLDRLGLDPGAGGRRRGAWWVAGGAAAAVASALLARAPELAGPTLILGALTGFAAAALAGAARRRHEARSAPAGNRTVILLTAVIAAHLVETAVGIAVTPTRLLLWVVLAALAAELVGWARLDAPAGDDAPPRLGDGSGAVARAALIGCTLAATTFSLAVIPAAAGAGTALLALLAAGGTVTAGPSALAVTVLLALAVLVPVAMSESGPPGRRATASVLWALAAAAPPVAVAVVLSARSAAVARLQRGGVGAVDLAEVVAGHVPVFALVLLAATAALAVAVLWQEPGGVRRPRPVDLARFALAATVIAGAIAASLPQLFAGVRADTFTKHANAYVGRG